MEIILEKYLKKRTKADFNVKKAKLIEMKIHSDDRGNLVAIEGETDLGYKIARVFYMYGMNKDTIRGKHANLRSTICFVALNGSCKITLDDGLCRESFILDRPETALVCYPLTWKEMSDFKANCVLACICDTNFDPLDYLDDYNDFLNKAKSV